MKPGPGRLRYGDRLLGCFRDAGFSKQLTYHGYHIIESYILGYTSMVLAYRAVDMDQFEDVLAALHERRLRQGVPALHRARAPAREPEPGQEDVNAYELGLDMILGGLEGERTAEATARNK